MSGEKRNYQEISTTSLIIDDADNARTQPVGVEDLMESIKQRGLLNPITVVPAEDKKYRVVAGFNRAHAITKLGLDKVQVMVGKEADKTDILLLQMSENLDRNGFTAYEVAVALQRLVDAGMSRNDISAKLGRSLAWCSNHLGFHDLPEEIQEKVKSDPENYGVTQIRFLHAMKKHLDKQELTRLSDKIPGKSQAQLGTMRERILKDTEPPTDEPSSELAESASPKAVWKPLPSLESEELDSSYLKCRPGFAVKKAIEVLASMGETTTDPAGIAKLQGAIEALQWVLGDDSHPLFQDVEVEIA